MLRPDGWLYNIIDRGTNALLLNLLWLVCCLPVVTAGAATCACYNTARKCILKNESPFFATFFRTFRANFRQATILGLFWTLLTAAFFVGASFASVGTVSGVGYNTLLIAVILCAALFFWSMALIARFENKTAIHLRNTVIMAVRHLGSTLLLLLCLVITIFSVYMFFPLIFALPVIAMLIWASRLERMLKKFKYIEDKERKDE